jgi:hypothetical protein
MTAYMAPAATATDGSTTSAGSTTTAAAPAPEVTPGLSPELAAEFANIHSQLQQAQALISSIRSTARMLERKVFTRELKAAHVESCSESAFRGFKKYAKTNLRLRCNSRCKGPLCDRCDRLVYEFVTKKQFPATFACQRAMFFQGSCEPSSKNGN